MDKLNNMASMRKALESVNRFFRDCAMAHAGYEATSDIWSIVEKALAEPARNCDVRGGLAEQQRRFDHWCHQHPDCEGCIIEKIKKRGDSCELIWAQMKYEAQEGDKP